MKKAIDFREAVNAISDVVQNRPRPLRMFDQIYMKAGDMVMQSELVASWADKKKLAFIGDGDAISVCTAYLKSLEIMDYGPEKITVFDFDERIVDAVNRFAEKKKIENLSAKLYNCVDAFEDIAKYDFFYTNPPWGEHNKGESVNVFAQRGMEATGFGGQGLIVIGDDEDREWTKTVLANVQASAAKQGFFVSRMMPRMHLYHLDDPGDLRSCNLQISALPGNNRTVTSSAITDPLRLENFYGLLQGPKVRYVRTTQPFEYGSAHESEYSLEPWELSK